jgi:hypothetical protein
MLSQSRTNMNTADPKPSNQAVYRLTPRSTGINICHATSPDRSRVEGFIKAGFDKAYKAHVSEFSPELIYVEDTRIRAALGIRSARSTLFLEQYLDLPIEHYVSTSSIVPRSRIAEIGNLCSSNRRFTIALFVAAAKILEQRKYTHAVFCATNKVAEIIESSGVPLNRIATANGARLGDRLTEWGSYYESEPVIVSMSLTDVADAIARAELISEQANQAERMLPRLESRVGNAICI